MSVSMPPLLVVQHEDECPPAWFGEWFDAAGSAYDVVAAHRAQPLPESLGDRHSGLLVLGGEMGAYDDERHPWLAATKRLIASTVLAGRPFLGICLGHQLAAVALGGDVVRNPHGHARGLTPFGPTEASRADGLLGGVPPGAPTVMWNHDVVARLPAGSVELATAPDGTVQAARFAPLAWGVQFHPEASPDIFDGWTVAKPAGASAAPEGLDVPAAAAAIRAAEVELRHTWRPVAERFAALVVAASTGAPADSAAGTAADTVSASAPAP